MALFGEMLSELRRDAGLTQKELADKLHVSAGTISNYENGVHFPEVDKLIDLAVLFNVSTDYLLGRCTSPLSLDVFGQKLLSERTAGDVVQEIQKLPQSRKLALSMFLDDAKLAAMLGQYGEKKA